MDFQSLYLDADGSAAGSSLVSPRITGSQGRLLCSLYLAEGAEKHPVIVFTHGFPGHEKNLDLAQAFRRIGFHVLIFFYGGSWGSQGSFSLASCLADTRTVVEYVLADENFRFDKSNIFLIGHSIGCFFAASVLTEYPQLRGAVFLMPCDLGQLYMTTRNNPESYRKFTRNLLEGAECLCGTSLQMLLDEISGNPEAYSFLGLAEKLACQRILWISSSTDDVAPEDIHTIPFMDLIRNRPDRRLVWRRLSTGHFYLDKRVQISREIASFLERNLQKSQSAGLDMETFQARLTDLLDKEYRTLTLRRAAEYFHVSESYLSSLIRKTQKRSFTEIVLELRMKKAGQMLLETGLPVSAISDSLGFSAPSYFMKVFKKYYGCTPSRFRTETGEITAENI